jgi:hygromycin-B 7''-O-kinase
MLPTVTTVAELEALQKRPELWRPTVAELVRSLGLTDTRLVDLSGGNLVVAVGDAHVLKLGPVAFERELRGEQHALPLVANRLPVATPVVIASGAIPGWLYVLTTLIPGRVAKTCWDEVPADARAPILFTIGKALAALHALPAPSEGPLAIDWNAWLERETRECCARQARWGVPAHLVEEMPDCLQRAELDQSARTVLCHGDVHDENVMLVRDADGWRVSGIIDFGDALRGDPAFDLITPALLIARGDRMLFHALLRGYGAELTPLFHARLVAYSILHRWNDLTRYIGWAHSPPVSMAEFGEVLFPF